MANLGPGQTFGELALRNENDTRSATVKAVTTLNCLCLNKLDYDKFVRDYQNAEQRENFYALRNCALFSSWQRNKIDSLVKLVVRKDYGPDQYVIRQNTEPDYFYIVLEGTYIILYSFLIKY